ncbi:MAG: class I SAM-dependent methyltransferase, partial [Actinomycetota bacterium]|nr:class I SAM-dependent methyltransferase [Actinomycetota bacterium]
RHPWELARARFFRARVGEHAHLASVRRVLDVGAGDGWFAHELRDDLPLQATIVCWDINYRSEDLAMPTGPGIVRTSEPPPGTFDVVTVLDVLEHIDDAETFLADEVVARIAGGGRVVFSVPSYQRLMSDHDRLLMHHRRYSPDEFRSLISRHLRIVAAGSLFTSLLAPRLVAVGLERLGRHRELSGIGAWRGGPALTTALTGALNADARLGHFLAEHGMRLPGLSTWAVATTYGPQGAS